MHDLQLKQNLMEPVVARAILNTSYNAWYVNLYLVKLITLSFDGKLRTLKRVPSNHCFSEHPTTEYRV